MSVRRRGSGRRWRPLLVVLALLGLLWMHGLGSHGTTGSPVAATAAGHAAHQAPADADGGHDGGSGDHGAHVMAAGLCLGLLLAVVLLPGRRGRGLLLRLRAAVSTVPVRVARPAPRARPPDLVALGVCRC